MSEEVKQVLADRNWWQEFGNRFGWKLLGFTRRWSALFSVSFEETITITYVVRAAIDAAFDKARNE